MDNQNLENEFSRQVNNIIYTEKKLNCFLGELFLAAAGTSLKEFIKCLKETAVIQIKRVRAVQEKCGPVAFRETEPALEQLIDEGSEYLSIGLTAEVRDAALIAILQRICFQRSLMYNRAIELGVASGNSFVAKLFDRTCQEIAQNANSLRTLSQIKISRDGIGIGEA